MNKPFVAAPVSGFEYEASEIIREAVDHDADKMRFYLNVSVGELAQRIAIAVERLTVKQDISEETK